MERDRERSFREKILEAELTPVLWRKEEVWSRMTQRKAKRRLIWAKYAAVLILGAVITFIYFQFQRQQSALEKRIAVLQDAIERRMQAAVMETPQETPERCNSAISSPVVKQRKRTPFRKIKEDKSSFAINSDSTASMPVAPISTASFDSTVKLAPLVVAEEKVQPIIGVVEQQSVQYERSRSRRRTIRFMRNAGTVYAKTEQASDLLVKRIK